MRVGIKRAKIKQIINEGTEKTGLPFVMYRVIESYKSGGQWKYTNITCYTHGDDTKKIELERFVQIQGNMTESVAQKEGRTYHNYILFTDSKKQESDPDGVKVLDMDNNMLKNNKTEQNTNIVENEELPFD